MDFNTQVGKRIRKEENVHSEKKLLLYENL